MFRKSVGKLNYSTGCKIKGKCVFSSSENHTHAENLSRYSLEKSSTIGP